MKTILGFQTSQAFINNVPGRVSEFFELSPLALTFSKNRAEYQSENHVGSILHVFKAYDDSTSALYVLPNTQSAEILDVLKAVHTYFLTATYPYDLSDLLNTVLSQFSGKIQDLAFGELHNGQTLTLPDWVSWTSMTHPGTTLKIWVRNEAFENQYSDYEIVVVPPIDSLDRFFGTYGNLADELSAITISDTVDRIEVFKASTPESYLRVVTFNFINAQNPTQKTPVNFSAIIYGKNGDNIDAIKDAIVAHLLKTSTHTQSEWEVIFPDLFKRTEFLFFPRWDKVAVPNQVSLAELYSSASDPLEIFNFAKRVWPSVDETYLENNLTVLPFDYKAITVLGLNGLSNVEGKKRLMDLFPDYLPVSTSSYDFNRMSLPTQQWVLIMVELIKMAETANEFSTIDTPFRRVTRGDLIYISRVVEGINYLIATKSSLPS